MTAPEDQNGLREALARVISPYAFQYSTPDNFGPDLEMAYFGALQRVALKTAGALIAGPLASLIADRASLRAAEAEITRLKEGMEAAKPKVWVVTNNERGAERRYRMWSGRAWVWTADPAQAAHFARKADANQILPDGCPFDYADRIATLSPKEHPHG